MLLYEQDGRLLRGDLVDGGDAMATTGATVVEPGVVLSAFPHDPELPALPRVMDPAQLGPALSAAVGGAWGRLDARQASRCRITLLRYRPGKRATVLVSHGAAPAVVAKAYHNPAKAAAVVEEAPDLHAATKGGGLLAFAPTLAFVPDLALVVQQVVHGVPLDSLLGGPRGTGHGASEALVHAARALAELHDAPVMSTRQRPVEKEPAQVPAAGRPDRDGRPARGTCRSAPRCPTDQHPRSPPSRPGRHRARRLQAEPVPHRGRPGVPARPRPLRRLRPGRRRGHLPRHAPPAGDPRRPGRSGAASRPHVRGAGALFTGAYLDNSAGDRHLARIQWQEAVALERKALRAFARAPHSPMAGALIWEAERCLDNLREAA